MSLDTYADDHRSYSYRRATHRGEPDYGREIAVIGLQWAVRDGIGYAPTLI